MVRAIFWRWPYLQQIFNNDHDANEIFSFRLRTYFKKSSEEDVRCYTISFVKTWIFGKRKSYSDDLVHATVERGVMAWGVENHLPSLQDGEDQNIISAYRVKLASQFNLTEEKRDDISPQATVTYTRDIYNTRGHWPLSNSAKWKTGIS